MSAAPPVEAVIAAAGGRDEDIRKLIAEYGAAFAQTLVDEVIARCDIDPDPSVGLELDGEVYLNRDADAIISTDLVSLTRSLFGPASFTGDGMRTVTITAADPGPATRAAQAVVAACASRPADLGDLAIRFGSDKWGAWHWYTRHYDRHFAALRHEPIRLLEIGIGGYADPAAGGASLRMWKRYFRRGLIFGLDLYDKTGVEESRIRTVSGSQDDPEFLTAYARDNGPFDIIIDDGSHLNSHVLTSFATLLPYVRPGGFYVIEDTQTSYWPQYGGTSGDTAGPATGIGLLKTLLDGLEYQESGRDPSYVDRHVVGVHCYHNLAFIEVGSNTETTLPTWVRRAPVSTFYQRAETKGAPA